MHFQTTHTTKKEARSLLFIKSGCEVYVIAGNPLSPTSGILADDCRELMSRFFRDKR